MRSLYWVFNLLAKAANTRMKAKAKNTKNTKLNWTTMQCNDCFVSAPIATDHFMCSFLAAKFAIWFRNTKTIGTDLVSGWWCRDILTDLGASSTFTFIEGTWCNQRPKTLIEGQHGATSDLYWRNMVQLEAKGWEVWKRKALATSTWQHVPMWWLLIKLLLRNLFVHDKRHKIKCLGHCRPFEWSMCETSNHLLVPRFLKSD